MSVVKEIEEFQKLIKEDISLDCELNDLDDYDKLLKNWDKYRDLQSQFLEPAPTDEFLNLRKSMNKICMPNLELENNKLDEAIKNISYDHPYSDLSCINNKE
ncbi:hypothetical protein AAJ76_1650004767 [Vairimorpha ceranae]|uniref:Uncharacterized protein n=1 Tax=Vairimorpha ceranae TaxID=40302 RepID=A0A0F9Z7P9_9MICR|nr:hypothetical protein AAJ76_1650004767 [Vairimorpha ceranae]KKO73949.1 hypothetical protein AAJ76_1650004767 [Vairimorpha ceranae]